MILSIDTSDNKKTIVELDGERLEVAFGLKSSQNLLPAINRLLRKKRVKLSELTEIRVNTGPGSFTGLKVGVSVANALGYALGIPVNGKKIGPKEIIEPVYTND